MPLLDIRNLTIEFKTGDEWVKAVDRVSMTLTGGEIRGLVGESGSGKDVAAQYIHACSRRSDMPLIAVNCNAYTESLLEAELFGHEQGAFTGAIKGRAGKFELADKSTLFLDEVGDINLTTQVKLLRAIETKRIERIGGNNSSL